MPDYEDLSREELIRRLRAAEALLRGNDGEPDASLQSALPAAPTEIDDLYRNAPIGLCVLDRELRWVRINDRLAEFNGIPAADHIGRRLPELMPAVAEATEPAIRAVLETGEPRLNIELLAETPAQPGTPRSWLMHLGPIRGEQGEVSGVSIVVEETTARRRAEAALRDSEERLRLAQQSARIGVWEWRPASGVTRWTPELEDLYGYSAGTCPSDYTSFANRVHPDDLAEIERRRDTAVAAHRPFDYDFRIRLPNGETRWINCKGAAAYDAAGNPERVFGVDIDITDRKRAEEALQAADRRKDEFLATLAHELRNPLVPIRNATEILRLQGPRNAAVQEIHDLIDRQVEHLARLIDDLLDVCRISRGKLDLRKAVVPLATVIEYALEFARPLIQAAGHRLTVSLPPEPIMLDADTLRLAQVFSNLLDNAAKFTEPGGEIGLSARCEGETLVVSITDTGIGIAPEDLPGVFDMFAQIPTPRERVRAGLGIGLALTRGLVEMHGGQIAADSEGRGKGSRFTVRLPLAKALAASVPGPAPRPVSGAENACRMLVVDDQPDVLHSLARLLRSLGQEVATASDGREALETAERFRPDLVLLDLGMPRLDGYATCQRLRAQPWGADLTIVATSGWGREEDRRRCEAAGFDRHLLKPVALADLLDLIAKARARAA